MIEKPPIGTRPAYIAAWSRIRELIAAIEREYPEGSPEYVEEWAEEIKMQCEIIKRFSISAKG